MKKNCFSRFIILFVSLVILTVPVFASLYASEQIRDYSINVSSGAKTINIKFTVSANDPVNKLGCESISIYEKAGTKWNYSDELSLSESDPGMSKSNSYVHKNTIYCNKSSATEYKVVVTVFAEDSQARDTRTEIFYV